MMNLHTAKDLLLPVASFVLAASVSAAPAEEVRVRALEAKAVCVALAAFQESAPKADLEHYAIVIGREGRNYHIIFAPDPGPGEETLVGGETKYGAVRGYVIAPRTFKILEMHFAK